MTTIEKLITIGLTGLLAYSVLKNNWIEKDVIELEDQLDYSEESFKILDGKFWDLIYQPQSKLSYTEPNGGRIEAQMTSEIIVDTLTLFADAKIAVAKPTEE